MLLDNSLLQVFTFVNSYSFILIFLIILEKIKITNRTILYFNFSGKNSKTSPTPEFFFFVKNKSNTK